mmetsp:Transcript_50413/g.126572  ORF Transcript_50413/g.126572 Transcript_50413/m.126572 type:complete len:220 (-) Transcript_50413:533-1192(-)
MTRRSSAMLSARSREPTFTADAVQPGVTELSRRMFFRPMGRPPRSDVRRSSTVTASCFSRVLSLNDVSSSFACSRFAVSSLLTVCSMLSEKVGARPRLAVPFFFFFARGQQAANSLPCMRKCAFLKSSRVRPPRYAVADAATTLSNAFFSAADRTARSRSPSSAFTLSSSPFASFTLTSLSNVSTNASHSFLHAGSASGLYLSRTALNSLAACATNFST